jgi:hypothetical protein
MPAAGSDRACRGVGLAAPSRYRGAVAPAASHDLFAATASTAGALTGLLFVALSVAPRGEPLTGPLVIRQIRAAAALLAFTNALAVSLFGLVPDTNPGYPAVVLGIIGILFTAAAIRSIRSSRAAQPLLFGQFELMGLLFLIFGAELVSGIVLIASPGSGIAVEIIGYALVASLIVGVSRAWELVGDRNTGIRASISVLAGHEPRPDPPQAEKSGQ